MVDPHPPGFRASQSILEGLKGLRPFESLQQETGNQEQLLMLLNEGKLEEAAELMLQSPFAGVGPGALKTMRGVPGVRMRAPGSRTVTEKPVDLEMTSRNQNPVPSPPEPTRSDMLLRVGPEPKPQSTGGKRPPEQELFDEARKLQEQPAVAKPEGPKLVESSTETLDDALFAPPAKKTRTKTEKYTSTGGFKLSDDVNNLVDGVNKRNQANPESAPFVMRQPNQDGTMTVRITPADEPKRNILSGFGGPNEIEKVFKTRSSAERWIKQRLANLGIDSGVKPGGFF